MKKSSHPRPAAKRGDRIYFERSVVPMWEEDISQTRALIAEWTSRAKGDLRAYLRAHPALVREGIRSINVVDVNQATLALYEAAGKKDLLGSLYATLAPEARHNFIELFVAVAEGRSQMEYESVARTLSGKLREVLVRTFIPSAQDRDVHMIVTIVDFSQYKRMERELQEERSLVRAVIDGVPDQIFVKDRDGRFLLANAPLARWAGESSASAMIGKTDYDFFPKKTADAFRRDDKKIIASGRARIDFEEEIISARGQRAWASTSKIPFKDATGAAAGIIGIVRDMTDRRRLEMAVEEERTLLRSAVKHIPDLIFLKDAEGRFLIANQAVADVMQAGNADRLIGKTDFDFYPRHMAEEFAADELRLRETGASIINKEEPKTMKGQVHWILTTKVPLFDARGKSMGIVGVGRDISSLKQTQEALAGSEGRYRTLLEDIGVGILSADAEGVITFANPMVGQIFGLPRGASIGKRIHEFISQEAFATVSKEIGRRKEGDKSSYEVPITRADGERRWIHLDAVSRFDASGKFRGTFATIQDVTDRYQAEKELAQQRSLMQALLDTVPDYIYFKDRESRFILNNKAHARELGAKDPAEMQGKRDFDYFAPEHAQKAYDDEQRIIATGTPLVNDVESETWVNRPPTWVSTTKVPLRNDKGEIIGTFGISRDMTERRRMEEKNLQLASMIESSNDAIIGIGLDDAVTSWNKGAENIFGYTAEEMMGRPITPLLSPETMTQEATLQEKLAQAGRVVHMESEVTRKDGGRIQVSTTISVIRDPDGQMIGIACISRDVTDQKALQVQIIRSQRLESLGTLAAGIAHQFNNINAAVRGYLDFLSQDPGMPSNARAYIRETIKAVQRATDITDRLQGLTTNAPAASPQEVNLEEAVPALTALFTKVLEKEGIMFAVDFPQALKVRISHSALEFLVTSLLTNSIHALIGRASPAITVRGGRRAGFCSLEVSDNGSGVPAENLPRIFTPFFTTKGEWAAPGSAQAAVKGIGLSLAVCQSTVAETGGWIEVENAPQGGAVFRVWLPSASGEAEK